MDVTIPGLPDCVECTRILTLNRALFCDSPPGILQHPLRRNAHFPNDQSLLRKLHLTNRPTATLPTSLSKSTNSPPPYHQKKWTGARRETHKQTYQHQSPATPGMCPPR